MIIWVIAAGAAVIAVSLLILYRRQVKKTCRQLEFLSENQTNLRLTADLPFPELCRLADDMNRIIDQSRQIRLDSRRSETQLKETITSLSHDIRTPLTSMDGYFQLLLESDAQEDRQRYISIIQSRIASLNDMLEELFTYARLQDSQYRFPSRRIDFSRCVCDTIFSFYEEFQAKGIEPSVTLEDERLFIQGNEEALGRTVQNLMKNTLVHGKGRIALSLFREDSCAVFQCANQVENPQEIDISQVFGRFYRADSARTKSSTGLGLSIARELTERMGGQIRADLDGNQFSVQIRFPEEGMIG